MDQTKLVEAALELVAQMSSWPKFPRHGRPIGGDHDFIGRNDEGWLDYKGGETDFIGRTDESIGGEGDII